MTNKFEKIEIEMVLWELYTRGNESSPRGLKIKELENFNYEFPPYTRFCNFESRKLNLPYIKQEFKWYLKGDLHDTSIAENAKMWKSLINENGTINSNYGHYIFASGAFYRVADELIEDKDSRRGSITILNDYHLLAGREGWTKDVPCTYSLNFRIRQNRLNMTVNMRSQDAVFGMGNDLPCFSFIHEMMFMCLKSIYEDLEYGSYYHHCDSFHVYERHFEMLDKIVNKNDKFEKIECPKISGKEEVQFLIKHNFENIPEDFKFTLWLNE